MFFYPYGSNKVIIVYLTLQIIYQFPVDKRVGTLGSCGQLVPGTVAKVVTPDGSLAGIDEDGELWVKGGQIALGYHGNQAA